MSYLARTPENLMRFSRIRKTHTCYFNLLFLFIYFSYKYREFAIFLNQKLLCDAVECYGHTETYHSLKVIINFFKVHVMK